MATIALLTSSPGNIITVAADNNLFKMIVLMISLGLITSAIPYLLYTFGLKGLPAGVATTLGIIEPLAATIYSILLLGESLDVYQTIGIVLIITAVVLLSRTEKTENE